MLLVAIADVLEKVVQPHNSNSVQSGFVPEIAVYTEALPEREEVAEAEVQELEVYTIEPEDLEVEDDAAPQPAPETIAGAQ